ncbi:MAG: hypothetical protein ABFD92_05315 [Planctomycetaceae bacterium]|nr:hypothetical protein [Planctomycetaceae bacterium]
MPASDHRIPGVHDESSLLADLRHALQEQLQCVREGLLDPASEICSRTNELLCRLGKIGVASSAGKAELAACRRLHQQVNLALSQQQGEVKAQLARVYPGKALVRAYGACGACASGSREVRR